MQTELTPYLECFDSARGTSAEPDLAALLQASYLEAQRVMSPLGLDNYLQGLRALSRLGKGQDLLLTYLQQIPSVVKAIGEDVLPDIVESMMQMASLTSGAVLTKVLDNLPFAAIRLGDADLMRAYFRLLSIVVLNAASFVLRAGRFTGKRMRFQSTKISQQTQLQHMVFPSWRLKTIYDSLAAKVI